MGLLEPGNEDYEGRHRKPSPAPRAIPGCCFACDSLDVGKHHCKVLDCTWVQCKKCLAVSAYVWQKLLTENSDTKVGYIRMWYGGVKRDGG
jgi:hypothetical protein